MSAVRARRQNETLLQLMLSIQVWQCSGCSISTRLPGRMQLRPSRKEFYMFMEQLSRKDNSPSPKDNCPSRKTRSDPSHPRRMLRTPIVLPTSSPKNYPSGKDVAVSFPEGPCLWNSLQSQRLWFGQSQFLIAVIHRTG